jgi:ABC-type phosphate transport system substrate-binding protein
MPLSRTRGVARQPTVIASRPAGRTRFIAALAASSFVAILCAGILTAVQAASATSFVPIAGAGSTWSYNAINDWIINVVPQGLVVHYNPLGSVSGQQEFADGVVDWGASDIPYGVRDGSTFYAPPR